MTIHFPGSSTGTTAFPPVTVYDPCEHLLTNIEYGNGGYEDIFQGSGSWHKPRSTTPSPFRLVHYFLDITFQLICNKMSFQVSSANFLPEVLCFDGVREEGFQSGGL